MKNCPSLPPSCRNPAHSKPLTKIQRIHHFISKGASKASYKYTFWSLSESAASLEPDHYISRVSFLACPCCFKEPSSLKYKCQMWPCNDAEPRRRFKCSYASRITQERRLEIARTTLIKSSYCKISWPQVGNLSSTLLKRRLMKLYMSSEIIHVLNIPKADLGCVSI